jgi:glycosyltransferase involved in cell wall biosynthesis
MKVSVIIPCYNDGHFLADAINSVLQYTDDEVEIIIVNDGSSDKETLAILKSYSDSDIKVLSHSNKGLAYSRNTGVKEAKGQYILPLDADNKIKPEYIKKAVEQLDANTCDIVYANPTLFGEKIAEREFYSQEFDGPLLLTRNYIDACAIYRKSIWEKTGGYDEHMPFQGNEDWDFWVNCYMSGFCFRYINEELFYYRVSNNSMISNIRKKENEINNNYIIIKYKEHIFHKLRQGIAYQKIHENDQKNYIRTSLKYLLKFLRIIR